jgi:hypothetical protein
MTKKTKNMGLALKERTELRWLLLLRLERTTRLGET